MMKAMRTEHLLQTDRPTRDDSTKNKDSNKKNSIVDNLISQSKPHTVCTNMKGHTYVLLLSLSSFRQAYRLSAYALNYKTWKTHIANPRTLVVLYPLLVVEGQGANCLSPVSRNRMGKSLGSILRELS